jgi:conflict system STAND superfamily ATPase
MPLGAVVGPSGSGKSSVVFAGLLPRLRQEAGWIIVSFRPGIRPFRSLAEALLEWLAPALSETDRLLEISKGAQRLQQGELALQDIVERLLQRSSGARLLLIIDQFEELYTLCREQEVRQHFLDEILTLVQVAFQASGPPCKVLLTLRADFLGHTLSYRPFADALLQPFTFVFIRPISWQ